MIPIGDDVSRTKTPFMTYGVVLFCICVFMEQLGEFGGREMIEKYAVVPKHVANAFKKDVLGQDDTKVSIHAPVQASPPTSSVWKTLLTSVFLHGDLSHLFWNMFALVIFGRSVENRIGHVGFAYVFVATGILSSVASVLVAVDSTTPSIGASGSIAGLKGAFLVLFFRSRILTVIPFGIAYPTFYVPAPLVVGIWFYFQMKWGIADLNGTVTSNIGWWAHIGGFVAGCVLLIVGSLVTMRWRSIKTSHAAMLA